jgi:hypothetical protein
MVKVPLPDDEPRGLEIRRSGGSEIVYVYYSGARSQVALTAHDATSLVALPRSRVPDQLIGHTIGLVPGAPVPPFGSGQGAQINTSLQRAFDFEIDERNGDSAFLLHAWTGNLGLLDSLPGDLFESIRAATRIRGGVSPLTSLSPKLEFLDPEFRQLEFQAEDVLNPRYLTTEFGQAMDLEQGSELLVAAYTGAVRQDVSQRGFLQLFFPERLREAQFQMGGQGRSPLTSTLDEILSGQPPYVSPPGVTPPDVFRRLRVDPSGLDSPRDVEMTDQISILVPSPGETVRGAVPVNVVTRDDRINRIRCALRRVDGSPLPPGSLFGSGGGLDTRQKQLGFSWRPGPGDAQRPICFFAQLSSGSYELEVTGEGPSPNPVARVRFEYRAQP